MPSPLPDARTRLEFAVAFDAALKGRGSEAQQRAAQELEWRFCADPKTGPFYFIARYGRLMGKDGKIGRWILWPIQVMLIKEWLKGKSTVAVKARQLGVTTLSAHFALWEVIFKDAVKWYAVSQSETSAKDLMGRIQATYDNLPEWMLGRASATVARAETNTQRKGRRLDRSEGLMRISSGRSDLSVLTSTAKSVQGKSGKFILDEFSNHPDKRRIYHLLLPSFDGGGQAIIIANGNGTDEFYEIYQAAVRKENGFVPHFFSWQDDPTRDEAWYEATRRAFMLDNTDADEYAFRAQYPSNVREAFFITGRSRFNLSRLNDIAEHLDQKALESRRAGMKWPAIGFLEPDGKNFRFAYHPNAGLRVFFHPEPGRRYVLGIDASGGGNAGDYSAVQVVMCPEDAGGQLVQVAEYQAKVDPTYLALVAENIARYYHDAFVVPERMGHGYALIAKMKETYWNIYQHVSLDRQVELEQETYGYPQNAATKPAAIHALAEKLHGGETYLEAGIRLYSRKVVDELSRFEFLDDKGVKMGAPKGAHDDLVMALALAVIGANEYGKRRSSGKVRHFSYAEF